MNFGWTKREKKLTLIFLCSLFLLISLYFYDHFQTPSPSNHAIPITTSTNHTQDALSAPEKEKSEDKNQTISVDIKGAVVHPGVYPMASGARINELIRLAGGLLPDADDRLVNQAKAVKDGDMIYIPRKDEKPPFISDRQSGSQGAGKGDALVHINTATLDELNKLPGIGEAKAKSIIQYRSSHGAFRSLEDLKKVNGIGEKLFERLKELISVD